LPPREIQVAMEKQMKAERERRAKILDAEGAKTSQILVAEGEKEAAILRAEAVKETKIREAQGEAEAIFVVQQAYADSLKMLNEAAPTDRVIALKSLEAFQKVADGRATKIIIPSDVQNMAGLATTLKEMVTDGNIDKTPKQPVNSAPVQTRRPHIDNTGVVNNAPSASVTRPVDAQNDLRYRAKQMLNQNAPRNN